MLAASNMGWWDWVGIAAAIIGGAAFLIALPPFIHFLINRPRLEISFSSERPDDQAQLRLRLRNRPCSGFWRQLGMQRATAHVQISYTIRKSDTGEEVAKLDAGPAMKALQPSTVPSQILIVRMTAKGAGAVGGPRVIKLDPGTYDFDLTIVEGGNSMTRAMSFVVPVDHQNLGWLG